MRFEADRWSGELAGKPRDERVDDLVDTVVFAVAVLLLALIAVL